LPLFKTKRKQNEYKTKGTMTEGNADTVNVLMVGTGEYTTGYVGGGAADSDKGAGVVALTMFDLRRRSKVNRVGMCGVNVSA
jgi:D-galacturonate reductase